jgi:hypothetical protein
MWALMKWEGCAARRGNVSRSSAESGAEAVEGAGGVGGVVEVGATAGLGGVIGALEIVFEVLVPSTGGSTCCVVELMNRARLGKRKVGGSVALGVRISNKDLLIVLLNMVYFDIVALRYNSLGDILL